MLNDMVSNAATVTTAWRTSVIRPRGPPGKTPWPAPVGILCKGIAGFCEHFYLISRFYKMSKNLPSTIILGILTVAHVGCHVAAAAYMFTNPAQLVGKGPNVVAITAAWSLGATVDILVAIGVVWQLHQRLDVVFVDTKSMVQKFLVRTVISGALTALFGVLFIILISTSKYAFLVLAVTMGKIYAITVLANLTLIQGMRRGVPGSQGIDTSTGLQFRSVRAYSGTGTNTSKSQSQSETNVPMVVFLDQPNRENA